MTLNRTTDRFAVFDADTGDQLSDPMSRTEARTWIADAGDDAFYGTRSLAARLVDR